MRIGNSLTHVGSTATFWIKFVH